MKYLCVTFLTAASILMLTLPAASQTLLASQSSTPEPPDGVSSSPDISSDSRLMVFSSTSTNLVSGDTNGAADVFLHTQENLLATPNPDGLRQTTLISKGLGGLPADGASSSPRISDNGRWIVFSSTATNLVASDTNGKSDIFLYNSDNLSLRRISLPITVFGVETGEADGDSVTPAISADGCYIAYASDATNLLALGQDGSSVTDTNGKRDIILYLNMAESSCGFSQLQNELINVGAGGQLANDDSSLPRIGGNAYVAFVSAATNLVADDTNGFADVFIRDRRLSIGDGRTTLLVSRSTTGSPGNGGSYSIDIEEGGNFAFDSDASDLVASDSNGKRDVFRRAITSSRTLTDSLLVSSKINGTQGNGDSSSPSLVNGANYIAFASDATNLSERTDCNNARDIFVRDYLLGTLRRVNLSTSGYQADTGSNSDLPALAPGALLVAYESSSDLLPSDTNQNVDIYASVASQDPQSRDNPLSAGVRLDEPPDVCVKGAAASVFMEYFSEVASSSFTHPSASATSTRCPANKICYSVDLTPTGKGARERDSAKKLVKRNQASFTKLKPGAYRVSFRASGQAGNRTITTNRSPKRKITIRARR
jgi:Tol biopolymer transport system component